MNQNKTVVIACEDIGSIVHFLGVFENITEAKDYFESLGGRFVEYITTWKVHLLETEKIYKPSIEITKELKENMEKEFNIDEDSYYLEASRIDLREVSINILTEFFADWE